MEPEDFLTWSKVPLTSSCPEPHQFTSQLPILFLYNPFNIILLSKLKSLSQINFLYNYPSYFSTILLILSSYLRLNLSSVLFHLHFPTKVLFGLLICLMHATYHGHLIFHLITLKIFGENKFLKLLTVQSSPVLCYFLTPLLGPDILPSSTLLWNTLNLCPSLSVTVRLSHHTKLLLLLLLLLLANRG